MGLSYGNPKRTRQSIYGRKPQAGRPPAEEAPVRPPIEQPAPKSEASPALTAPERRQQAVEAAAGHIVTGSLFDVDVAKQLLHEQDGPLLRRDAQALAGETVELFNTEAGQRAAMLPETALNIIMNSLIG